MGTQLCLADLALGVRYSLRLTKKHWTNFVSTPVPKNLCLWTSLLSTYSLRYFSPERVPDGPGCPQNPHPTQLFILNSFCFNKFVLKLIPGFAPTQVHQVPVGAPHADQAGASGLPYISQWDSPSPSHHKHQPKWANVRRWKETQILRGSDPLVIKL